MGIQILFCSGAGGSVVAKQLLLHPDSAGQAPEKLREKGTCAPFPTVRAQGCWRVTSHLCELLFTQTLGPWCQALWSDMEVKIWWWRLLPVPPLPRPLYLPRNSALSLVILLIAHRLCRGTSERSRLALGHHGLTASTVGALWHLCDTSTAVCSSRQRWPR